MSAGLAPHDRRLRRRRFEVAGFGPAFGEQNRRRMTTETARFATLSAAEEYAETLSDSLVTIDRWTCHPRYAEAPWTSTRVRSYDHETTS